MCKLLHMQILLHIVAWLLPPRSLATRTSWSGRGGASWAAATCADNVLQAKLETQIQLSRTQGVFRDLHYKAPAHFARHMAHCMNLNLVQACHMDRSNSRMAGWMPST